MKAFSLSLVVSCYLTLGLFYSPGVITLIHAQEITPSPIPSISPSPSPIAHLTFRTCLVPETNVFRLSFRADYVPGEYRVVGQSSGVTINLGYLEVGQEGGGFGDDNTSYILPAEDTWIKQWYNGTRWQRSGGLPVTNIEEHIQTGKICEVGQHTPYLSSSNVETTTLVATDTAASQGVGGTSPLPQPQANQNLAQGIVANSPIPEVLGVSTMAPTGINKNIAFASQIIIGFLFVIEGFRRVYKKSNNDDFIFI